MKRYNPSEIEPKWQKIWRETQIYTAKDFDDKPKYTVLTEFPYPSGAAMHMGHAMTFTGGDIVARYKRAQGLNVLFPMGFDAFGLPAENFAIKNKVTPQAAVEQNVTHFRKQLDQFGYSIDWNRSFSTTDPEYYRWTQWFFLQFFKNGLAYQDEIAINWCPFCKTGLANEEVVNGRHERCENLVEKKKLKQWMLRITDYADRLIDGLADVDYPPQVADQQINWVGKSTGAEIDFALADAPNRPNQYASFIMGTDDISNELKELGIKIVNITDKHYYCVMIPKDKIDDYEKLISNKLKPGFWNEYIGDEVVFIFKGKDGEILRLVWDNKTELDIIDLCELYADAEFSSVEAMLEDNDFYRSTGLLHAASNDNKVKIFTTRPDTIFGATFMVLAPEHPLVAEITTPEQKAEVDTYIKVAQGKSDVERQENKEKTGVFTGAYAINPATNEKIPIWVADYIMMGYGTGAIMAVPAHDERDYEFAKKFNLPIIEVISGGDITEAAYTGEGKMTNSGEFDGMGSEEAGKQTTVKFGKEKVQYKLRDWVYSRQRYWGEPIPIIHCGKCGAVPVPDDQLPVELPVVDHYEPTDDGQSPLSKIGTFVNTTCPKCGMPAKRETDTMPNWAGSNWYYLRYFDAHNNKAFADEKKLKYWGMVDMYLGGMEHTTLHLLYSRFHHQFLYDQGLVPTLEPYAARRGHGMILAADGTKMSKSKGNVVDPTEVINSGYGADAVRLATVFLAPYDQTTPWSPEAVAGTYRFLTRVWKLVQEHVNPSPLSAKEVRDDDTLLHMQHRTVRKVTEDLEKLHFNTAIAALMEYLNALNADLDKVSRDNLEILLRLLAPFAPHIASELYEQLGNKNPIEDAGWPEFDEKYLQTDEITIAVQVNGKLRGEVKIAKGADQPTIEGAALAIENVQNFVGDKKPARIIYVPGKIINIVV